MKLPFNKISSILLLLVITVNSAFAGITITRSNGMRFTGADGIDFFGTDGLRFTGADGFINTQVNGLRFTGADGLRFTGADGMRFTGADGLTFLGTDGARFTGADGITINNIDGLRFTGADGFRFTGADGTVYQANSVVIRNANGISSIGTAGISLAGTDGLRFTGADGTAVSADGMRLTGADALRFTGADSITGFDANGPIFNLISPVNFSITGTDGLRFTGADATLTKLNGLVFQGVDGLRFTGADQYLPGLNGLQGLDPELALTLDRLTDDSNVNAVVVFHQYPGPGDLNDLRQIGILGGTIFRKLPMIYVTGTRQQLAAVSQLQNVRSIYGNRTLKFDSDPYFKPTMVQRVAPDRELQSRNNGLPVTGKNVTVAVLDTGVNALHRDLNGKVVQNVKLLDLQSLPLGFNYPLPIEGLPNTDLLSGHGTFVSGIIAGNGASSNGKYGGVAPGAKILGLSAGDVDLTFVLSGFDYLLDKGANYNVRIVNCSFSADTVFDYNDPVNIATKMLTDRGVNIVFSAGNNGPANATINPYSVAPWVISVGAADNNGALADFSGRGVFGDPLFKPSLVAPGVNIASLRALLTQTGTLGLLGADTQRLNLLELPFYTTASGTSFTAPQVSGAIALMLEANPNLSPKEVKDILQRSATPMPNYFAHEAGAGMLNTYAAVLESSFPTRSMGLVRAGLDSDGAKFGSQTQEIADNQPAAPGSTTTVATGFPVNTVQYSSFLAWKTDGQNDLNLNVVDLLGALTGGSNRANSSGIFGHSESVTVTRPATPSLLTQIIASPVNIGPQSSMRASDYTQVTFAQFSDTGSLSTQDRSALNEALRKFLVKPTSAATFSPGSAITRAELAEAILRSGKISQYLAAASPYSDITDLTTRSAVEAAQYNPSGILFYDATAGGQFRPDQPASRLVAAVALVKAAQLDNAAANACLPYGISDASLIPANLRGYVAVALQKGWLTVTNNRFDPRNSINRMDLARAMSGLTR
jgi:serine protease AprX